jgi:hypothetical protein
VSWRRADDPEVLSINRQLKISPVSRYDAGTYICSAANAIGAGSNQQWTIDVQCKLGSCHMLTLRPFSSLFKIWMKRRIPSIVNCCHQWSILEFFLESYSIQYASVIISLNGLHFVHWFF